MKPNILMGCYWSDYTYNQ